MSQLLLAARLLFGAWMLASGLNHFVHFYPEPVGHLPLAVQMMNALDHSELINVVRVMQLITGALILAGVFVPAALCVVMPVTVCAAYWAVVLDRQPLAALLALAALALNGLLMLAYLDYYRDMLQRRAIAIGEAS